MHGAYQLTHSKVRMNHASVLTYAAIFVLHYTFGDLPIKLSDSDFSQRLDIFINFKIRYSVNIQDVNTHTSSKEKFLITVDDS